MEFVVDSRFYSRARARARRKDAALESAILTAKVACLAFSQIVHISSSAMLSDHCRANPIRELESQR